MHLEVWRLSPGSSSRALEEGVVIQVFKISEKRPGWPQQALTACFAMTNQHLVSFVNRLALNIFQNGITSQVRV